MTWNLSRPGKAALPNSYLWTWDHRTNWVLDDPGLVSFGCGNKYMKRPETFVEDYRRLTDLASGLGIGGIVIWGFLRDSHGGIEAARKVADYAVSKGVSIMPGVGTNWYGGCYYNGDHPYNIETFIAKHPEARLVNKAWEMGGKYGATGISPTHPLFAEWLKEGIQWLFREFSIGGVNLENGDYIVDSSEASEMHKKNWPADDPDVFRTQYLSYKPAIHAVEDLLDDRLVTYATYSGFNPGEVPADQPQTWAYMRCKRPAILDRLPQSAVCQWTLTDMLFSNPLPLAAYLDDGSPREVFDNPNWPRNLKSPAGRAVGYLHHGNGRTRYSLIISTIKEACLRGYLSGLEGISIYGEVTSRYIPWALNYLAFSHFTHWPEDTMRDFGRKTLGQVLGSADDGEAFIETLSLWQGGTLSQVQRDDVHVRTEALAYKVSSRGERLESWHFWRWLDWMVNNPQEEYAAGFF